MLSEQTIVSLLGDSVGLGLLAYYLVKIAPKKEEKEAEERDKLVVAFREEAAEQRALFREEQEALRVDHKASMDKLIDAVIAHNE